MDRRSRYHVLTDWIWELIYASHRMEFHQPSANVLCWLFIVSTIKRFYPNQSLQMLLFQFDCRFWFDEQKQQTKKHLFHKNRIVDTQWIRVFELLNFKRQKTREKNHFFTKSLNESLSSPELTGHLCHQFKWNSFILLLNFYLFSIWNTTWSEFVFIISSDRGKLIKSIKVILYIDHDNQRMYQFRIDVLIEWYFIEITLFFFKSNDWIIL